MRKKILLIFTLLLIFTVSLSLDSYTYTEDDRVYTWEDTSVTANGLTLTIDEETQIFTITGSMTSTQSMFTIPQSLYTANDALSSLSSSNDYIIEYENINDTTFDATVMAFKFNTGVNADNTYQDLKVASADLKNKAYSVLSSDGIQSDPSFLVYGAYDNDVDISFNLNIYEYDTRTLSSIDLFDTNMSITEGSLDITITDFNTITLDGSSSSSQASISLTSYLNDAIDDSKTYLIKYIYVSGSMTDSIGQKLYPFKVNDQIAIKLSEANKDMFQAISIPDIITLSVNPYISGNVSYTNFTYKLLLEEVGADATVVDDDPGYQVFIDNYSITGSGLTLSISEGHTITIDGTTTEVGLTWDLSGHLNDADINSNLEYIVRYEYVSGTITSTDSTTSMLNMLYFTNDSDSLYASLFNTAEYDSDKNYRVMGDDFLSLAPKLSGAFTQTITYDNLVYRYYINDADVEVPAVINYYIDGSIDNTVTTTVGASVINPGVPALADHVFIGYYLEDTYVTLFDFSSDVVESEILNLYARFVADTADVFTIIFDTNSGSLIDERNVLSGEAVDQPSNPTRSGYTFNGWFSDEALTTSYDFDTLIDSDLTIYAKWTVSASAPVIPALNTITPIQWILIGLGGIAIAYVIIKYSKK